MSIKVDEQDPIGELEPSFPYRDVKIRRNVDMKDFYDLEGEIGRGKFGTVYRCREKSTDLTLAAKFVGIGRREDRRNVEREVQIMRMLQHPRIIQLYDACEAANVMCVIQELIEGGELFDRVIGDDFILTEKSCTVFVRQICEGVAFIHSKNVLHLDLKPENILCLTKTGNRIKIIDFGLARQYDPSKKLQVLFGTPEFVAPEVVNFDAIGFGTDMWSVGVICYVLLSGLSPFMGETDVETMANVTVAQYDFDDEAFDDISEDAKDFIRKLLAKNISCRYTAAECLTHPWLLRRPLPAPGLDTSKENLRDTVERWGERQPSPPVQASAILHSIVPPHIVSQLYELSAPIDGPQAASPSQTLIASQLAIKTLPDTNVDPGPPTIENKCENISDINTVTQEGERSKLRKRSEDLPPSPFLTKQAKTEVHNKEINDPSVDDVKVSTYAWTKKKPTCSSQMSLPEGKISQKAFKDDLKPNMAAKFSPKFPLKPASSVENTGNVFTSRIQQGGTEITISKKSLNPSPQPKISGIILGQTHPRVPDSVTKKSEVTDTKPKVITHKIIVEGKDVTDNLSNETPTNVSKPINIDNQQSLNHPLLKSLQTDRFERRCSDISCFMQEIESSTDGASIINEIKKLSSRLFESDLLDSSNNINTSSLIRQIANRGVAPRRPKFRVTNLNRDVPIGSPPPPTNMTYFIPPNILTPNSYLFQTHSAPQSPRGSPERTSQSIDKDVILRLFNKLDEHSENTNSFGISESQKKVSSISSK